MWLVWSKTKKGAQQYFKHLIQVRFFLLVYGSWNCLPVWRTCFLFRFLHVVNYKIVRWVRLCADWLWRKNLKTLRVQAPWWNGKQMCIRCNFSFLFIQFSFEMGFSLEPLPHTKRHDKYIFTLPTTWNVRWTFCVTKWVSTSPPKEYFEECDSSNWDKWMVVSLSISARFNAKFEFVLSQNKKTILEVSFQSQ